MASTIMLGEEDITRYLGPEPRKDPNIQGKLEEQIRDAEYLTVEFERGFLAEKRRALVEELYQRLDVSFLTQSIVTSIDGRTIQVPRFCVYPLNKSNSFTLGIRGSLQNIFGPLFKPNYGIIANIWNGDEPTKYSPERRLPSLLLMPLLMSTGLFEEGPLAEREEDLWRESNKSRAERYELAKKMNAPLGSELKLKISTHLNTLVPRKIKGNIDLLKQRFRLKDYTDGCYLVAEKKGGEWNNSEVFTTSPIILIGVNDRHAYFIDSFNQPTEKSGVAA